MNVVKFKTCQGDKGAAVTLQRYSVRDCLLEANQKLKINGFLVVTNSEGNEVDEDGLLEYFCLEEKESFVILEHGEEWIEPRASNGSEEKTPGTQSQKKASTTRSRENASNYNNNLPQGQSDEENRKSTEILEEEEVESTITANVLSGINVADEVKAVLQSKEPLDLENFGIPWATIGPNTLKALQKNELISAKMKRKMLNRIVDEIRFYSKHSLASVFKKVAITLEGAFSKNFEERVKDIRCGAGIQSTVTVTTHYNGNLNRACFSKSLSKELHIPINKQKSLGNIKAGCSNW